MKVQTEEAATLIPFLIFRLGEQRYALGIDEVVEVAAMVQLIATPDTNAIFLGLANRHGAALPVLDLRPVFGQDGAHIDTSTVFIVARAADQQVGLVVDEVLHIEYFDLQQVPASSAQNRHVRGVIARDEELFQLIALPSLLTKYLSSDGPANTEGGQAL